MKKRLALFLGLAVVLAVFVGIPLYRLLSAGRKAEAAAPAAPVIVGPLPRGRISDSIYYPGILTAETTVFVVPKLAGKVVELGVKEGERVEAGRLILRIEDGVPRLQAEQAKAALDGARAQREKARRGVRPEELENARASLADAEKALEDGRTNLERTKKLHQAGAVPASKLEEAEAALRSAEVQLANARRGLDMMEEGATKEDLAMVGASEAAARAQYELAVLQLGWAELRAPVSGLVARLMAERGGMVAPGGPVAAIVQDGSVLAKLALPEKLYGRLSAASAETRVLVRPIAYAEERVFEGRLATVGETVDPETRTFQAEAAVENPARLLKPGMYINAEIVLAEFKDALLAPESALVSRGGRRGVFAVDSGGRAAFLPLELGIESGGKVQVLGGLEGGEAVILKGNAFLEEGQPVAVSADGRLASGERASGVSAGAGEE